MDRDTRSKFAAAAATQTISENEFWKQVETLVDPFGDPIAGIAFETATHYRGNFHSKNILFVPVKPDEYQIKQGQGELNIIADGLEGDWSVSELKRRLRDL